jgi:dihydrodipicolinate synthase/N-acetylneuraminate lyase
MQEFSGQAISGHALSGIWVPLVTPFKTQAVDHAALRRLVEELARSGIAGFVVCGSTGEAGALDDDEQLAVLHTVFEARAACRVIMGASGVKPAGVSARLARLRELPLAAFLVPAPYYVRPSQAGLAQFFTSIADDAPHPIVLYDIPVRTERGDLGAARALWQALWPLTKVLFEEPHPAPLKAALAKRLGLPGELRAPMTPATPACAQCVQDALSRLDALRPIPNETS